MRSATFRLASAYTTTLPLDTLTSQPSDHALRTLSRATTRPSHQPAINLCLPQPLLVILCLLGCFGVVQMSAQRCCILDPCKSGKRRKTGAKCAVHKDDENCSPVAKRWCSVCAHDDLCTYCGFKQLCKSGKRRKMGTRSARRANPRQVYHSLFCEVNVVS